MDGAQSVDPAAGEGSRQSPATVPAGTVAVVTCVEAGHLEPQTVRMIESLRRFGGGLAAVPVLAVTPRFGLPLQRATLRRYEQLDVRHVRGRATSRYAWYNFMNKPAALRLAERAVSAETMVFLDADLLVVREPTRLLLGPGEDLTACATDKNIGSSGPDDPYEPYWTAVCGAVGLAVDDLPWVTAFREGCRVRTYFNGGVIAYRTASGFTAAYAETVERLMDARVQLPKDGYFYHEQAAVGLAAVKAKLRVRELDESHNYQCGSSTPQNIDPEKFRTAHVLHYHRAMQYGNWPWLMNLLAGPYPEVRAWLEPKGPLAGEVPRWRRGLDRVIRGVRSRAGRRYKATCRTV